MPVTTWLPRIVGGLGLLAIIRLLPPALTSAFPAAIGWALVVGTWLVAALALLRGEQHRFAAAALAVCALATMPAVEPQDAPDLALLAWVCLIIAVTHDRPRERALLLRVCVSAVYAFTAAAKLNPAFLSGEQLTHLLRTRSHLGWLEPALASDLLVNLAVATVLIEAWLAAGLWWARTRKATAGLGVGFHLLLIGAGALPTVTDLTLLVVLNGLLVGCYAAFFVDVGRPERSGRRHVAARK